MALLNNQLPIEFIALIKGLLHPDPSKRLTIEKVLQLPIFQQEGFLFASEEVRKYAFEQLMLSSAERVDESTQTSISLDRDHDENYTNHYHKIIHNSSLSWANIRKQSTQNTYEYPNNVKAASERL